MDKEIKRAKVFNYVVFGIVILLVFAIAGFIIFEMTKPLCSSVTFSGLQTEISETNNYILAKTGDDEYFEISASIELGNIFSFDSWELVDEAPNGEIVASLRLAELYILEIYDNGYAAVYDGYAPIKTVSYAYYEISNDVSTALVSYLRQNGVPHELGDGTIGMGTFNH